MLHKGTTTTVMATNIHKATTTDNDAAEKLLSTQQHSGLLPASQQPRSPRSNLTNTIIGWILLGGVILSATVILCGLALLLMRHESLNAQALQAFPQTLSQVWSGVLALQPQAVITLGLLLLIATPVMRVAVSVVAFAIEKDRRYVVITPASAGYPAHQHVHRGQTGSRQR